MVLRGNLNEISLCLERKPAFQSGGVVPRAGQLAPSLFMINSTESTIFKSYPSDVRKRANPKNVTSPPLNWTTLHEIS